MLNFFKYSNSRKYSDVEIIEGIKKGALNGNPYIDYLYRNYLPLIIRLVKANQGTEIEAKDIFQDGIIKFYQYTINGKFREECSIKTYLYTICRGLWLNELKRLGRKNTIYRDLITPIDLEVEKETPLKILLKNEGKSFFDDLLTPFRTSCQEIIRLYYYHNKSMKEIAEIRGLKNEEVAKSQKYKCMQELKKHVGEQTVLRTHLEEYLRSISLFAS